MDPYLAKISRFTAAAFTSVLLFTITYLWMQPPQSVFM